MKEFLKKIIGRYRNEEESITEYIALAIKTKELEDGDFTEFYQRLHNRMKPKYSSQAKWAEACMTITGNEAAYSRSLKELYDKEDITT